jgi:choline dehydrogenase-like flavoprotein
MDGIRQTQDVHSDVREIADYVIIGTGAAGASAARVLSVAGFDVVMIEEGPWIPKEEFRQDTWSAFKTLWRDAGFQVSEGRSFFPALQGSAVGGSTVVNGAIVHRIPEEIHANWGAASGVDGVFSLSELERAYDTLDRELNVGPGPEGVLGNNNGFMRDGANAMGIRSNVIRRNAVNCQGSNLCLNGCRGGRKQSMNFTFIPTSLRHGARVFATCKAERIESKGGRAVAVRGRFKDDRETGRKGRALRIEVRKGILVAASAVQTPLLLAASGVGRQSRLVGKRYQCHPGSGFMAAFDKPVDMHAGITQGYETTHWWSEKMKFESVGVPIEVAGGRYPGFGRELVKKIADYRHHASWGVQVRSDSHGTVKRGLSGRTVIKWDFSDADLQTLKVGLKRLGTMMFEAGARVVWPGVHGLPDELDSVDQLDKLDDLPNDPRLFHGISSHLFGTATMGVDPAKSVVGPTLQSHELEGLYVVDSSVFPTNMGVNPAHTISAIAWLAAERLADAG